MKTRIIFLFSVMCIIALLTSAFTSSAASLTVPVPKAPIGIITDTTPVFKWTPVAGAVYYKLEIYRGTTRVLAPSVPKSDCSATMCSYPLMTDLNYASHKWHVKAVAGGVSSAWSAYKSFTVTHVPVSFNSQFNGSMADWKSLGIIPWKVSDTAMYSFGDEEDCSNVYRSNSIAYKNFDYSAKMKCTTTGYCENYLAVRMGMRVGGDENCWGPGYLFGYDNDGYVAIYKVVNDKWVEIVDSLNSTIKKADWNTIRVVATGSTFKFYANGKLLHTISDSTIKIGGVGVLMWEHGTTELLVDWAKLTVLP